MNIDQKIAELDALIEDRTKIERELWTDSLAKEKVYQLSNRAWAGVRGEILDMVEKRKALVSIQKDCECAISSGVADEDIGRTVPLPPEVKGIGGVMYPNIQADKHLIRTQIFKGDQEREFIEPK